MFRSYDDISPTGHEVEAGEAGPSGSLQMIPRWESSHTPTMDEMSHSTIVNQSYYCFP